MANERATAGEMMVVIRDDDGIAYAVPEREMEVFRMTADRLAVVAARLHERTPNEPAPIYEVDPAGLAPYRLSKEAWTELEASLHEHRGDVAGFEFQGQFPGWVAVAPPVAGAAAARSNIHTYPSWYWFNSGGGAGRNGPYPGLR